MNGAGPLPESSPESAPSSSGDQAILQVAGQIVGRIAAAAAEDMRARYELGQVVLRLRQKRSRAAALTVLDSTARTLNLGPSTLRRYARVAATIHQSEFDFYLALSSPDGWKLTWSHLEELAEVRGADWRRHCASLATTECLSVGGLRARLRARQRS